MQRDAIDQGCGGEEEGVMEVPAASSLVRVVEGLQRQLETCGASPQFVVLMNESIRLNSLSDRIVGPQGWTLVLQIHWRLA